MSPETRRITGDPPTPLSTFIGRDQEIAYVLEQLSAHRLVTLTGPGGCGKTRLAIQVTNEIRGKFDQGASFVEFAPLTDPQAVPQALASLYGVHEQRQLDLTDELLHFLSHRQALLVFDNCEHLVEACAQLAERLLQNCPQLKILATSREAMDIASELIYNVPPLSLPDPQPWRDPASGSAALLAYQESESIRLFIDRAQTVLPQFSLTLENGAKIAEICRRLDGMPLAIELAAARVRTLSVQQIAERLDDRFSLLTRGTRTAPPRHQTLAATLDWSYALLSETERSVLQRLSVFAGGATLEAAESVCGKEADNVLDTLSHLVDKSLVTVDRPQGGETRYRLLETIRQYAQEKLVESGNFEQAKKSHCDHFIQWAERAGQFLDDAAESVWLERYEAEHDNLHAALEWCNSADNTADENLRLVVACGRFWRLRGYLSEGRAHIRSALSKGSAQVRTEARARALFWGAALAYLQSDYPATGQLGKESLELWRELNPANQAGLADTLDLLGELATEEGDYATAPLLFEEALRIFRKLENSRGIGDMLMQLGWAYMRMGDYDRVASHMEEALALFRKIGTVSLGGFALAGLGELAIRQGQYERATRMLEESLEIRKQHGYRWSIGASLGSLGWVALAQKDLKPMRKWLRESLDIRIEIGDQGGIAWCLEKLAEAKKIEGQLEQAAKILGYAEALRAPLGSVIDPADQAHYDRIIAGLRSGLGMEAFSVLWEEGKKMQLEEVVDCALSEPLPTAELTRVEKAKYGGLTAREREVAILIARGRSNREIAEAMTVGVKTVETYITRVLNKLGCNSRVQIATWALEKGLK